MKNIVDAICLLVPCIILMIIVYQFLFSKDLEKWLIEQILSFVTQLLAFSFIDPEGFIILSILTKKIIDKMDCEELDEFMTNINKWFFL